MSMSMAPPICRRCAHIWPARPTPGFTLSRHPTSAERDRMLAFVQQQAQALGNNPQARDRALVEMCQVLMCLNEFIYVD